MKTYIFALAVAVAVLASIANATCVKSSLASMGRLNAALSGGK